MQPQLQLVKVKALISHDHNLAIQHAPLRQTRSQWIQQLGEISIQRFFISALNQDFIVFSKDQGTKPIPLRFENPHPAARQFVNALREHGQNWRIYSKLHEAMLSRHFTRHAAPRAGKLRPLLVS